MAPHSIPSTFYLAGPTAVGKSEIAVAVAERIGAEIIGCDAFQVYAGLPILTAQPAGELRQRVTHHLVGTVSLSQSFDAAQYLDSANEAIREVHSRGRHVLVVGGSGMYLRALTHGLADLPKAHLPLRVELEHLKADELCAILKRLDPAYYLQVDKKNSRRLVRALEVCLLTGKPYSELRQQWQTPTKPLRGALLTRARTSLDERIAGRVDAMFRAGVVDEVSSLADLGPTASNAIGLESIRKFLSGDLTKGEASAEIALSTRRYAKRQMTWFRREQWLQAVDLDGIPSVEQAAETVSAMLMR